jgi:Ca-activated chloride channel family protein
MLIAPFLLILLVLVAGTARNPNFWRTPDQRGDALFRAGKFSEAARAYSDPARVAAAQYRNGDFEAAAKTFARVPGAVGAFDQGNAWLMHGQYDTAVASYDRALGFRPGWPEALENKAVALARKAKLQASGKDREQEQTDKGKPDEIVFDQKGSDRKGEPVELAQQEVSDEELRATWLRQVKTTPGDFLRAKFAYQAARPPQPAAKEVTR